MLHLIVIKLIYQVSHIFKAEFDIWKLYVLQIEEAKQRTTIQQSLKMLKLINFFYLNIYTLLKLYTLIPVSIAGTKRLFSLLKLIETNSTNRICSELLSDLNMIGMHKNIAHQLNIDNVVDEFAKKNFRLSFVN